MCHAPLLALTIWNACWFPGICLKCPSCKQVAHGAVRWAKPRILHMIDQDAVFLATRHSCLWCAANGRSASTQKQTLRFCASDIDTIELLPGYVKTLWTLHHNNGRLCDETVVDLIRAMATRSTWAKIAAVLNELRATHAARLNVQYMELCAALGMMPSLHAGGAGTTRMLDR